MGYAYGIIEAVVKAFMEFVNAHPLLVTRLGKLIFGLGALSIVVGTLIGVFGFLASGIGNTWGVLGMFRGPMASLLSNGLSTFMGLWSGLQIFKDSLGLAIKLIGVMAGVAFPSLGAAIAGVGALIEATPLGWILTALAILVVLGRPLTPCCFKERNFPKLGLGR